jgi:5-methyltetrahydropteroyltriglutamate--homocysteine methyltransferase
VKLDGKILIPGAVTHSNVTVEHPEVVADRIERWARAAGRENVMFGNDCGFASTAGNTEIPTSVAWAKLAALGEGARIASAATPAGLRIFLDPARENVYKGRAGLPR